MKIAIGCDHGGYSLKEEIKRRLVTAGYDIMDKGIESLKEVDYPDIAKLVGESVTSGETEKGILICGTGIGMSIAANKVKGVRAALITDTFSARMAMEHNNANVIAIGERTIGVELAYEIVNAYLKSSFLGDKHQLRVEKINSME